MNEPVGLLEPHGADSRQRSARRVLLPLSVPVEDPRIIGTALDWARANAGSVVLLHVVDFGSLISGMEASPLISSPQYWEKATRRYLHRLAQRIIVATVPCEILVRHGKPAREIVQAARDIGADLIFLQSRRTTWLAHWGLGDTAAEVKAHAPCSVMLLREAD